MGLALLGVKLDAKHVVIPDAGDKAHAIIGRRRHDPIAQWLHIKRVREVEIGILGDTVENRRAPGYVCLIPAHMRYFKPMTLRIGETMRKPPNSPMQNVQAFVAAEFFAFGHQQLQAEADAQVGASGPDELEHRFEEVMLPKLRHAIAEGPLPRQNEGLRARDILGMLGDLCRVSDTLERLMHTAQITDATVHDGDHGLQFPLG
jgi:hypothetical protein